MIVVVMGTVGVLGDSVVFVGVKVGNIVTCDEETGIVVTRAGVLSEVVDIVGGVVVLEVVAANVIVVSPVFELGASDEVAADLMVEGTNVVAEADVVCAVVLSEVVDLIGTGLKTVDED